MQVFIVTWDVGEGESIYGVYSTKIKADAVAKDTKEEYPFDIVDVTEYEVEE